MADFLRMLANVSKRYGSTFDLTGRGIGIAAAYFKAVATGADGQPLSDPWKLAGVTEKQWVSAQKESESKFVWRDDQMIVTGGLNKELKSFGVPQRKDTSALTKDACLDFEGVATSKNKDRDGDILEPMGAVFDPHQSLLLHHNPALPIGRMVQVVEQNNEHVKNHWAVANTPLGMDSARLIEFGAFRLSIGFQPVDFKSIGEDSPGYNEDERNGWHVLKSYVMETSCVTVPANKDAIITQFSREKLTSDYLKKWAETFFDARPCVGKGGYNPITGSLQLPPSNVNVTVNINGEKSVTPQVKKNEPGEDDPKPKADDDKNDNTKSQNENPALKAIEESIKGLCGMKDMPQEAVDRLGTMTNMLGKVKEAHSDAMGKISEAAKSGDISAINEAMDAHSQATTGGLAKMSAEMETIKGIDELTDVHKSAIDEAHDNIKLVHDCFSGLSRKEEDADGNEMEDEDKEEDEEEEKDTDSDENEDGDEDENKDQNDEEDYTEEDESKDADDDSEEDEEEKDQTITSAPPYGDEVAADDDDVEGWDGDGKSVNDLALKLIGGFVVGKKLDADVLASLKESVDAEFDAHLDGLLEEALA